MYVNDCNVYPSTAYVATYLVGLRFEIGAGGTVQMREPVEQSIRRCPTRVIGTTGVGPLGVSTGSTSYGYNGAGYISRLPLNESLGLGGRLADGNYRSVSEAEVRVPSDMLALGDNLELLPKSGSDFPVDTVIESEGGMDRQETSGDRGDSVVDRVKRAAARHRNQGNVEFCDGHVEALTFRRLFLDRDDASLRRWNRDNEPHR